MMRIQMKAFSDNDRLLRNSLSICTGNCFCVHNLFSLYLTTHEEVKSHYENQPIQIY